jgi:hypothetical protein
LPRLGTAAFFFLKSVKNIMHKRSKKGKRCLALVRTKKTGRMLPAGPLSHRLSAEPYPC